MEKNSGKIDFWKHFWLGALLLVMASALLAGCGKDTALVGEKELTDGEYTIEVTLGGGSGRASVDSPAELTVENGAASARITWSSPNYDYMLVAGEKYLPVNEEGNSSFLIPVTEFDCEMDVAADTTAMSKPHEIAYTLYFDSSTVRPVSGGAKAKTDSEGKKEASEDAGQAEASGEETGGSSAGEIEKIPEIEGLIYTETVSLDYAECFRIYRYKGGYSVIRIDDGNDYLIVPEGKEAPKALPESFTVLKKPLDRIYLAASAVMSLFDSADALDFVRLSGLRADAWCIDNAKKAMEAGDILFAGKYSEPDYELLLSEHCNLAVESTMILHNPEVKEKLEALQIPVLIDRSSYESEPLGRTEWIKLYGELTGREDEAESYFEGQKAQVEELSGFENTKKTVAFFYINDSGMVVTRKSSDYLAKMIEDAGGEYIFDSLGEDTGGSSSVTMSMEEFYATAASADYLIYNATIEEPLNSVEELLEKSELFADFKAVQKGNVWCMGKYLYQATNVIGSMTLEFHTMLTDGEAENLSSMTRLK